MAVTQNVSTITVPASGDLSLNQFKFHTINASGQAALTGTLGGRMDGVLANKPTAVGQACELQIDGVPKVIASAAITPGGEVASTAAGLAVAAISTYFVFGVYIGTAACAANQLIPILVDKYYKP